MSLSGFKKKGIISILSLFCLLLILASCQTEKKKISGDNIIKHSKLLTIIENDGYDEVFISNPKGERVAHYVLVDRDEDISKVELDEDAILIKTPLKSTILDSEVYASIFSELNGVESIKGMFDTDFVTSTSLKKLIQESEIANVGRTSSPNIEKIIKMNPDAIFISYFEGMQTQAVDNTGIPIIKMYDLQENEPLGRAEWIRFIGRLLGKGEDADKIFDKVEKDYNQHTAKETSPQKKILTELVYGGSWNVAGGGSYQANLIKDAGGNYFKKDDNSKITLMLSPEQVLKDGGDSEIWLIRYFGNEEELKKILDSEPVYKEIKAYKTGNIYFSDTSKSGLFLETPFHPELLLNDYKNIFSGNPKELKYFKKLEM